MASERYLLEEMPEIERHAFEEHFFSCADCAEDVRTAELMRAGASDAGQKQPLVFRPRHTRSWSVAVPWAAAASLALIVGYQFSVAPGPARPYALDPVTVRAANRGADAVVSLGADDPAVVLAIEADAPDGASEWLYELRDSDDRQVAAGRTSLQARGAPLLLWVPASALSRPGRYVLSLRDREDAPPLTDYPFRVVAR